MDTWNILICCLAPKVEFLRDGTAMHNEWPLNAQIFGEWNLCINILRKVIYYY